MPTETIRWQLRRARVSTVRSPTAYQCRASEGATASAFVQGAHPGGFDVHQPQPGHRIAMRAREGKVAAVGRAAGFMAMAWSSAARRAALPWRRRPALRCCGRIDRQSLARRLRGRRLRSRCPARRRLHRSIACARRGCASTANRWSSHPGGCSRCHPPCRAGAKQLRACPSSRFHSAATWRGAGCHARIDLNDRCHLERCFAGRPSQVRRALRQADHKPGLAATAWHHVLPRRARASGERAPDEGDVAVVLAAGRAHGASRGFGGSGATQVPVFCSR
jgi:hypothetical protein